MLTVLDKLSCAKEEAKRKLLDCEDYFSRNPSPRWNLNVFYNKPIYRQIIDDNTLYIIPSPYIAIFSTGWMFWSLLRQNNSPQIVQDLIAQNVGKALENYSNE